MKVLLLLLFIGAAFALPQISSDGAGRIVGGEATDIDKYPYMTSLLTSGLSSFYYQACGGSLVTQYTILTAAHCIYEERANAWRVIVGSQYATVWRPPYAYQIVPAYFLLHPTFNYYTLVSDIALIVLTTPASATTHVNYARVPSATYSIPDGSPLEIIGWGALVYEGPKTNQLQHATINLVNHQICTERYQYLKTQPGYEKFYDVTPDMICAGLLDVGGKDTCQGDSGGPLVHDSNVIMGITSWAFECADAFYPGVYTRVNRFTQWIVDNAKN